MSNSKCSFLRVALAAIAVSSYAFQTTAPRSTARLSSLSSDDAVLANAAFDLGINIALWELTSADSLKEDPASVATEERTIKRNATRLSVSLAPDPEGIARLLATQTPVDPAAGAAEYSKVASSWTRQITSALQGGDRLTTCFTVGVRLAAPLVRARRYATRKDETTPSGAREVKEQLILVRQGLLHIQIGRAHV